MVIASWLLTPFIGAVLDMSIAPHSTQVPLLSSSGFIYPDEQERLLNGSVLNQAYTVSWLNASIPPFVTSSNSITPFCFPSSDYAQDIQDLNGSVQVLTTQYFSKIHCEPAAMLNLSRFTCEHYDSCESDPFAGYEVNFTAGRGCDLTYSFITPPQKSYSYLVAWLTLSANDPSSSIIGNCSDSYSNALFGLITQINTLNFTSLICLPQYFQQSVRATVSTGNFSVLETYNVSEPSAISDAFKSSAFESMISSLLPLTTGPGVTLDTDISEMISGKKERLQKTHPDADFDDAPFGPWIFTQQSESFSRYMNPDFLACAIERAHQSLFSLAINRVLTQPSSNGSLTSGLWTRNQAGITVSTPFTIASQVALAILAAIGVLITAANFRRPMRLTQDPENLLRVCALLDSPLVKHIQHLEGDVAKAESCIRAQKYKIHQQTTKIQDCSREQPSTLPHSSLSNIKRRRALHSMSLGTLLPLLTIFMASIMLLIILQSRITKYDGLRSPTQTPFLRQLLLSYLPTAAATLIEPVWVVMVRDACFMEPFKLLSKGDARIRSSLGAKFASVPPQFAFLAAIRSRRWFLTFLGILTISGNILSVFASGLFEIRPIQVTRPVLFNYHSSAKLQDSSYLRTSPNSPYDYLYLVHQSYEDVNSYPKWTDGDHFFNPFGLDVPANRESMHRAETTGFGIDPSCNSDDMSAVLIISPDDTVWIEVTLKNKSSARVNPIMMPKNGPGTITCYCSWPVGVLYHERSVYQQEEHQRVAQEITDVFRSRKVILTSPEPRVTSVDYHSEQPEPESDQLCSTFLLLGWLRMNANLEEEIGIPCENGTLSKITGNFLACNLELTSSLYDVEVDPHGKILKATSLQSGIPKQSPTFNNHSELYVYESEPFQNFTAGKYNNNYEWHTEPVAVGWLNSFLLRLTGSSDLVDPLKRLPLPENIAPKVEEVLRRFGAIFLALNQQIFQPAVNATQEQQKQAHVEGSLQVTEDRIFLASKAFEIVVAILTLDLLAIVIVLSNRPKANLPRMPTNILAVVQYVCYSHMLKDLMEGKVTPEEMEKDTKTRYGYGTFIGTDGKPHVGIERRPMVSPIRREGKLRKVWKWLRRE